MYNNWDSVRNQFVTSPLSYIDKLEYHNLHEANNKGTNQTVLMRKMIFALLFTSFVDSFSVGDY